MLDAQPRDAHHLVPRPHPPHRVVRIAPQQRPDVFPRQRVLQRVPIDRVRRASAFDRPPQLDLDVFALAVPRRAQKRWINRRARRRRGRPSVPPSLRRARGVMQPRIQSRQPSQSLRARVRDAVPVANPRRRGGDDVIARIGVPVVPRARDRRHGVDDRARRREIHVRDPQRDGVAATRVAVPLARHRGAPRRRRVARGARERRRVARGARRHRDATTARTRCDARDSSRRIA